MKFTVFDASVTPDVVRRWVTGFTSVEEFFNDCHDPKSGRFCSSPGGRLLRTIRKEGGATLDYENNMAPIRSGYAVAARPAHAAVFSLDGAGRKQVDSWLVANKDLLSKKDFHVGAWHDKATGKVWLDITRVYPNTSHGRTLALRTAGRHSQIAIFHLDKMEEIEKRNADEIRAMTASADDDNEYARYAVHHPSCGRWTHSDREEFYSPTQPRAKDGKFSTYGSGSVVPSVRAAEARAGYGSRSDHDLSAVKAAPVAYRTRVGQMYDEMPENDPNVHHAWAALRGEIQEQYDYMTKVAGVKVKVTADDPYASVTEMVADVERGQLKILSAATTGGHPYFSNRELEMFRAVHDFYGHAATGRDFGRHGERAAFLSHAGMMKSKDSVRAAFTELEMQNAYLTTYKDFGPNKIALASDSMVFRGIDSSAMTAAAGRTRSAAEQMKRRRSSRSVGGMRDPSLRWAWLYDILRSKGYSKEAAAKISNSRAHLRKKGRINVLNYKQADNMAAVRRAMHKPSR